MSKQEPKTSKRMMAYRIGALVMASLMVLGSVAGAILLLLS